MLNENKQKNCFKTYFESPCLKILFTVWSLWTRKYSVSTPVFSYYWIHHMCGILFKELKSEDALSTVSRTGIIIP